MDTLTSIKVFRQIVESGSQVFQDRLAAFEIDPPRLSEAQGPVARLRAASHQHRRCLGVHHQRLPG